MGKYIEFASRIRYAMSMKSIRNKDVVARCSELGYTIHASTVSQYLSGRFAPTDERVELMAQVLGVDKEWLRGRDAVEDMQGRISGDELQRTLKHLNDTFVKLSPDLQRTMVKIMDALLVISNVDDIFHQHQKSKKEWDKFYKKHRGKAAKKGVRIKLKKK